MSYGKATAAPTQITDLIFIGSNKHGRDLAVSNPSGIRAVLNVGDRGEYAKADSIDYRRISLLDSGPVSRDELVACLAFVYYHVNRGSRVLIHCNAGRNRSAAIAIAHFVISGQARDWDTAYKYVKSRRESVGVRVAIRMSILFAIDEPTSISMQDAWEGAHNERQEIRHRSGNPAGHTTKNTTRKANEEDHTESRSQEAGPGKAAGVRAPGSPGHPRLPVDDATRNRRQVRDQPAGDLGHRDAAWRQAQARSGIAGEHAVEEVFGRVTHEVRNPPNGGAWWSAPELNPNPLVVLQQK